MTEIERLDLRSEDITSEKLEELLHLFPEARTGGGKIDFDRLKLALGSTVDVGKERYGLNWPGKADCFKTIQAPSLGTLLPARDESVNFDTTENLLIEGDNLEVLKLLQKSYLGQVKLIYIDPPYNTGNDFIYPDDYSESLQTYLEYTGQIDAMGRKFNTNTEADGRFHSKWLNMMYPRLYLARNLLREDGAAFISIDDGELENLRKLCNEVFGEENFIATVIWQKVYAPKSSARHFSEDHDYIVVYARNGEVWRPTLLARTAEQDAHYSNPDNDPRGDWRADGMSGRNYYGRGVYSITTPSGRIIPGPPTGRYWIYSEDRFKDMDADRRIWWGTDGNNNPAVKRFRSEVMQGRVPQTLWFYEDVGHTQEAKKELLEFVSYENTDNVLDSVKPTRLITRMLQIATTPNEKDIVLDFFAGSGSTAHAVLKQNAADDGNRRVMLVQIPEPLPVPESSLKTLADVAKERLRHAGEKLDVSSNGKLPVAGERQDRGFRVFKLAESNFTTWDAEMPRDADALVEQLELHIDHVREGRSPEDILYEILLKSGYPPTIPVESSTIAGRTIFSVAEGLLLVCLEEEVTLDVVRTMAEMKPERVVCLDASFADNDQLKANAAQLFKNKDIVFRTV